MYVHNLSIGLGPKSRQALVGNPGTRNVRKSLDKKFSELMYQVGNGVCGLDWDRADIPVNKLHCVTLEGGLHTWDCRTLSKAAELAGTRVKVAGGTVWTGRPCPQVECHKFHDSTV